MNTHTLLAADHAGMLLVRALRATMTLLAARVARTRERTLHTRVRAVSLVVANLAAVEALSRQPTAALLRLRAISGEVTVGAAAGDHVSRIFGHQ